MTRQHRGKRTYWFYVCILAVTLPRAAWQFRTWPSLYGQVVETVETLPARAEVEVAADFAVDPQRVEGHEKCVDCHKSEYVAWLKTYHAVEAFDKLRTSQTSREFARALGIPLENIARDSVCTTCHATRQFDRQGRQRTIAGISCEACHGASGGDDGWLNLHAVYGPPGTQRETETSDHYQLRVARCAQNGQIRVADAFRLACACYQCHMVGNESLVNVAGHPTGNSKGFEFATWSAGEVRHNFHLDQGKNALASTLWTDPLRRPNGQVGTSDQRFRIMYVAGQLAQLYVGLINRARARDTEHQEFAEAMNSRIQAAWDELEAIIDESDEELPSIQRALDAATDIIDEHLDEVDPASASVLLQAAEEVAAAARQFGQRHDGSELKFLDEDEAGFVPIITAGPNDEDNQARYTDEYKARVGIPD